MLNFYADAGLTLQLSSFTPKRFLFPDAGGSRTSQVWLGDPYTSTVAIQASPGANTISLTDTGEFLNTADINKTSAHIATAIAGTQIITYTGKNQAQLIGVSGITETILEGTIIYPYVVYYGENGANIEAFPTGSDLLNYLIKVSVGSTSLLSFPGLPAIFSQTSISIGVQNAIQVYLSVRVPAGANQEFTQFGVQCNNLYKRDIADETPFSDIEATYAPLGNLYCYRHDEELSTPVRI